MGNWKKTLEKLMSGQADAGIGYEDLCHLLRRLGYTAKQSGSHNVFRKPGSQLINVQNSGGKAKSYQVAQIREILSNEQK
jgi:hypothetical protein